MSRYRPHHRHTPDEFGVVFASSQRRRSAEHAAASDGAARRRVGMGS